MEQQSSHPIADAITTSFKDLDLGAVDDRTPIEEITEQGLKRYHSS